MPRQAQGRHGVALAALLLVVGACELVEQLEDVGEEMVVASAGDDSVADPARTDQIDGDAELLGLEKRPDGTFTYADPAGRFAAVVAADGTVTFEDAPEPSRFDEGIRIRGPGDAARRPDKHVGARQTLLEDTRFLRARMAVRFARDAAKTQMSELDARLGRVWTSATLDPAARRRTLFRLWDELEESSAPRPDTHADGAVERIRRAAAAKARQRIEAFVREHAPQGSPQGYGPRELKKLNAGRLSRDPFTPYGSDPSALSPIRLDPPRTTPE